MARQLALPKAVGAAITTLLSQRVHPTFAGYLCLKREAARVGSTVNLKPDFREFYDTFLQVPGGPPRRPYCRPFWDEPDAGRERAWYQRNIAGTYAPSSARRIPRFAAVVEISGSTYSLRSKHWELARTHLLFDKSLPSFPLALFLYRDYEIDLGEKADLGRLVRVFRDEFGYPAEAEREFNHLFTTDGLLDKATNYFGT